VNIVNRNFQVETATISSLLKDFYVPELEGLIGIKCFTKIAKFTHRFPENLSPFFGYEIQLGTNNNQADFLFCISDPVEVRNYVDSEKSGFTGNSFDTETINGLDNFSEYWNAACAQSENQINNIWFEFDYNEIEKERPKACFFFGPKLNVNQLEVLLLTERVFGEIFDKNVGANTLKKLLEIVQALEKGTFISQIGMMNSRNDENLRLFIQGKKENWIKPFLQKLNYAHINNPEFITILEACNQIAENVDLDIDISTKLGDNIGLECYFNTAEKALSFLDYLEKNKLAISEKCTLLKNYIVCLAPDKTKSYQAFFSHFKIVFKPGLGFNSKAYFGYTTTRLAPELIRTRPFKSD